ncbi:hypothetical protein RhiirA1_478186 [Rhizophagus irregularis]|uniref:Uncharacterized protein n=1 Tax=Rhizophagus irregularis TaxID=588596 RepID=A0A2N0QSE3_9GLOM|nr:hypothetical protein RhiirA1_478186 [Rhizophagus irregularis]CAB4492360.1 unnamed protein product [Rhizophagus irregularis]
MIRIYHFNIKLVKIKAHSNNENNKKVDKLAKLGMEKETLIIEDTLLLHNSTICWQDMPVKYNPILIIKGIKNAQFIDEFLGLNRNEIYKQPELLELIDWKISLKLNCIDQHNTLFENHFLQLFRIKICCNELPTCVNLKKWKPDIYDESWKCNFCSIEEHLWRCDKIQNVMQYIVKGFKLFLVNIIFEISKNDLDRHQVECKVEELDMWDLNSLYDFTFLLKNQLSHQLVDLLKLYIITNTKVLEKILKLIISKIILDFKILIWEYRNEL